MTGVLYFCARRLVSCALALLLVVTLTFCLMKALPGDPFSDEELLSGEVHAAMQAYYHLDAPLHEQYLVYLKRIATLDFGTSLRHQSRSVNEILTSGIHVSATFGLEGMVLALLLGIPLGGLAAFKRGTLFDRGVSFLAMSWISIPTFMTGALLQYIFAIKLQWLPIARWGTFAQTILPACSVAILPMAYIARLTRTALIDVLGQDYIRTARSKGLTRWQILGCHALPNALMPVISYLVPLLAHMLSGTLVIESIYGLPGLGQWWIKAILNRDYPVIMAITTFYGTLLLVGSLLADLAYACFDPRLKSTFFHKNAAYTLSCKGAR